MAIIDITHHVQDAPLYPGVPPGVTEKLCDVKKGDPYSVSKFIFTSHLGTHADAFSHFVAGDLDIEQLDLDYYYGSAEVISVAPQRLITKQDLEGRLAGTERLVIHGGGESYLSKDAADYLVAQKIKTLVTDACSVAPLNNETEIHTTLFKAKVAVVENVALEGVEDGGYILVAFPIKIKGSDGAPVRAVLIR